MKIKPFKAFRYNSSVVGNSGDCIAPPYDVIDDNFREDLYQKNQYNIIRVIKGKTTDSDSEDNNQYTRAADFLISWIKEGALKQDSQEAIYGYVQDFDLGDRQVQRHSFISLAKLEEFGKVVKPHEQILEKPIADRLKLKKTTQADIGLVYMLYDDQQQVADKIIVSYVNKEAQLDFVDHQQVRHRIYAITDKAEIEQIVKMMSDKSCVIADGHHRYTTGLTYSKQTNNPDAKYQMIGFANTVQDGLVVLATHRIISNLPDFQMSKLLGDLEEKFQVTKYESALPQSKTEAKEKMLQKMHEEHDKDNSAFGIYGADGAFYVAVLKDRSIMDDVAGDMSPAWRELDLAILHKIILERLLGIDEESLSKGENIQYVKDTPTAIDDSIADVDDGLKQVAFFTNAVKIQQLNDVTDAGERMPQKSTYFYPKLFSGLTINKL